MTLSLDINEILRYMRMGRAAPSPELLSRLNELLCEAPLTPKSAWRREGDRVWMCGTLGTDFDAWHRRVSILSAADALIAQAIGTDAIEKVMDTIEEAVRPTLAENERLLPRRSPGYGELPLEMSRDILIKLNATKRLGITLTATNLLVPSKSVTAFADIERKEA